ncbi:MAG TPA: hypothetical protein PK745_01730 [bacterium]|nr:hypothetical protein [bacterium]
MSILTTVDKSIARRVLLFATLFVLSVVLSGCSDFERWKSEALSGVVESNEKLPNHGMSFSLTGDHTIIGVGMGETAEERIMWRGNVSMSGPALKRGDTVKISANIKLVDKDIKRIIKKSRSEEIYMIAVVSPLYNEDGWFRQFTNIQMSCLLTPSGLPIETLQENLPAKFKKNHFSTPWEIVVKGRPSEILKGNRLVFEAESKVPEELRDGHYRMALEFGARIKGQPVKLELVPYLGSIMLNEWKSRKEFLTANATEKTKIRMHHSPVFKVGDPAAPRMPWTLFGHVVTRGPRGILANEDKGHFAINYSGLRYDKVIIPMKDRMGGKTVYRIEPDFPTQNQKQELFEKTTFYGYLDTVLSHIQLDPVKLDYSTGYLEVAVRAPSGAERSTGKVPFKEASDYGATTGDDRFNFTFDEYGHHIVEMRGEIEDVNGIKYSGGGTYDVWVANPLSMSTSAKPGMPYVVGGMYSPRVTVHPGVPADMKFSAALYRNSSKDDVKFWTHEGKANKFGYYFPSGDFEPMKFDAPGEYIAEVVATYAEPDGTLWMGAQTTAGVVAPPDSNLFVHGDIRAVQSRPFHLEAPFDFSPRFELKAGGYAGTPEINDMTMTQVRMGLPHNKEDMLFYSPALLWNVGEIFPLFSFSTTDKSVEREVLERFPPFESYIKKTHGESLKDFEDCWGRVFAVDSCDSLLLDMMDASLHKSADNLTVMSRGKNGYHPHSFQEDPEILSYYYSSAIKPGLLGRYAVSDSTNSTSYWIVTPNFFGRQFGAGEGGDIKGDIYRFLGGVVYRNLKTGVNKYGIYHGAGVVGDPRDENNRVEEPLKSPLVRVGRKDYYVFAGMSPEQGAIYETGDRIVGGGFIFPSIVTDVDFKFEAPDGTILEEELKTNPLGLFGLFKEKRILDKPGRYRVFVNVKANGHEGGTLGKPDSWYDIYVVEKGSPYEIELKLPKVSTFDITDVLEIKGSLPEEWAEGKLYYTLVSPGVQISDGEIHLEGRNFAYRYNPLHANVFYPSLEIYDIVNNRPGGFDTILLSLFADGKTRDGKRITAAAELMTRGNIVINEKGSVFHGPPPPIKAAPMYKPFDIDTTPYAYSVDDIPKVKDPNELIERKCGSCHSKIDGRRTFREWKHIVNWHMDRNDLWLRDYNRRGLVEALSKTHPAEKTKQAKAEAEIVRKGEKLFRKRCLWCHPKEPTLDRSRSLKGWENIAARHEYWEAKWKKGNRLIARKGKKVFANEKEKQALVEYLNLVAGSEAALPDRAPSDPRLMFQRLCFDCHATTLGVYDWKKADRKFLDAHAASKFSGAERATAKKVIGWLCEGKYEESKRNGSGR